MHQEFIAELARVFDSEAKARHLVESAGIDPVLLSPWGNLAPLDYWRTVAREIDKGLVPNGTEALLDAALRAYPHNPVFGELRGLPPKPVPVPPDVPPRSWIQRHPGAAATLFVGFLTAGVALWLGTGKPTMEVVEPQSSVETEAEPIQVTFNVLDAVTDARISGATLVLDEQGSSRETDSNGRARLSVRPELDKVRVSVSAGGYAARNLELDVFEGMDPVRVLLDPAP